jgi:proline racemase
VHESITGSLYHCHIESMTRLSAVDAAIPIVRGHAFVVGEGRLFVDDRDEFAYGLAVR